MEIGRNLTVFLSYNRLKSLYCGQLAGKRLCFSVRVFPRKPLNNKHFVRSHANSVSVDGRSKVTRLQNTLEQ